MRYLIALLILFVPLVATADPSVEPRMQFTSAPGSYSCSSLPQGLVCRLTVAIAETERATGAVSFQRGGIICINGDTASTTSASAVGWLWQQAVDANTANGSLPITTSTAVLVGGADCWGVVGSGHLIFTSAPLTTVAITITGQ